MDHDLPHLDLESHYKDHLNNLLQRFLRMKNELDSQRSETLSQSQSQSLVDVERGITIGVETLRELVTYSCEAMEKIPLLEMKDSFRDKLVEAALWLNHFFEYTLTTSSSGSQSQQEFKELYAKDVIDTGLVYYVDFLLDFMKGQKDSGTRKDVGFMITAFELVNDIFNELQSAQIKLILIQKLIVGSTELMEWIILNLKKSPFGDDHFWKREVLMNYLKLLESAIVSSSTRFIQAYPSVKEQLKKLETTFNEKFKAYALYCLIVTRMYATLKVIKRGGVKGILDQSRTRVENVIAVDELVEEMKFENNDSHSQNQHCTSGSESEVWIL